MLTCMVYAELGSALPGGTPTLVGTALFFVDLGAFLWAVFAAVEIQMAHLRDLGLGGEVEGLPEEERETRVPGV